MDLEANLWVKTEIYDLYNYIYVYNCNNIYIIFIYN